MKQHIIIAVCMVLLMCLLGFWVIVFPTYKQFSAKKMQLESQSSELSLIKSQYNNCKQLKAKIAKTTAENQHGMATLMGPQPLNHLLARISQLLSSNHLEIKRLQPSTKSTEGNQKLSTYTLQAVGKYVQLIKFLQVIVNQLSSVKITSFQIKKLDGTDQVEFTLNLDMPHV